MKHPNAVLYTGFDFTVAEAIELLEQLDSLPVRGLLLDMREHLRDMIATTQQQPENTSTDVYSCRYASCSVNFRNRRRR